MRCSEKVTATGTAYWGMPISFSLVTVEYFVNSLRSERSATITRYEIKFSSNTGYQDKRVFQAEDEREQFIKKNFSDIKLIDSDPDSLFTEREYFLGRVAGDQLVSVTFILDYLQLQFENDHRFNCYRWPVVYQDGEPITEGVLGYRDRLCEFIGSEVIGVDLYLDAGLVFRFINGTVGIPLDAANDDSEPEIVSYQGPDGIWAVWRVGEDLV